MHSRSLTTASAMLATYVTIADARFGVSPAAIGGDRVVEGHAVDDAVATYLPSWSALFDEASWCDCPECRSVLSPAAYLVDLLAFLDATAPDAAGDSPLDVLLRRRPDLAQLPLTCENTNVTLPYVDLVLEVLESLVLSGDPATIPAYDTEDATSAELVATPQHTGWAAYLSAANPAAPTPPVRPDTAAYPPSLPYDAALAAVRGYAEHLGVPWRDVLETLAGPALPRPDARIAERLGLTPTGYALISGQTVEGGPADAAGLDERFGWTVTGHPELAAGSTGWGAWALAHALAAGGAAVVPATAPATQVADAAVVAAVGAVQTAAGLPVAATVDESTWAAVLAGTPAAPWLLTQVTTLLDRAEIGYDDLQALLRMRFVNPGQASFDILQALRLPTADLLAFQAAGLTGASPALEAALTARGVSLADFTAWAADHLLGPAWDVLRRSVLLDVPADGSGGLAAVTLRHWDDADPWLGEAEWLGLDRLLRLWRTLGWTLDQLDVVLVGLGARELTPAVLASVGQVADLAAGLGLPVEQVTALWTDLDPTRPGSVYQQLFRGRTARRVDPVFEPDWRGGVLAGATLEAHGPAVQAALRVSAADLALLVDAVGLDPTAALDLAGLSALHRRVRLARGLGHPVKDLVAVQQVTGIDPFTAPGPGWTAAALVTAVRRLDQAGLDPGRLTRITADVSSPTPPDETAAARVLGELRTGLRAVTAAADPALEHDGSQTRAALDTLGVPAALTDAVVQLLTGRFTTTQALAAAPVPAPAVDPAWSARARYSAIDRTVTVGEALTEAERVTLSGWSADPGWVAAVQAAFDAPRTVWAALSAALASAGVAPVPSVTLLDTALPSDPVARESAVVTRLQTLLAGLEPTLTDRRGRLLVAQTLAALPMDPALVAAVLDGTLDDGTPVLPAADPTRPVVVDLLAVAGGTDGDPLPAAAVAAYALLDRLRLLAEALGLAGDDAVALVRHVVALRATPDVLLAWPQVERALAYDRVRDRSAEPAAVAALAETTDPAALPALVGRVAGAGLDLVGALVAPTGWDLASDDLRDPVHLDQLLDALATVTALGVDPDVLLGWSRSPVGAETADGMRRAVAARYDDTTWLDVARSLNDPLREKRRAALVAHLAPRLGAGDADGLYQQLLIDVEMTPAVLTSRIKQAISTVQLFVQRALLDLEAEVAPTVIDRDHWGWMQSYRVWEANRLVLLFPWHWTLPELRDDKTPAFRELESALLGDELTPANTERALRGYLDALDEVANLEVVAVHVQRDFEATEKLESVVHIVGRTANLPRRTHYRRCTTTTTGVTTWTPWEVVPLDVVGDLVTAVTFQRRLYLFWASSTTKTKPAATSSTKAQDPTYLQELSLSWAEHRHGEWGPKHMTDAGTVLVSDLDPASPDPVVERLETRVEGGTLRVLGIASRSIIWTDEDKNISYEPVVVLDGSGTLPAGKDGNQGYTFSFGSFVLDGCHGKLVVSTERDQTWLEQGLVLRTTAGLEAKPLARTPVPAVGLLGRAPGARITEGAWIHPDGDAAVLADGHRTFLLTLHQVLRPGWETLATPERTYPQVGSALTTTTVDRSHAALLATTRLAGVLQNQQVAESQSHSWAAAGAALATVALRVPAGPGLDRLVAVDPAVPASRLDPGVRVSAVASNLGRWFARPQTTVSATFEPLFHPFVCTYLERLEQSGVPGLMTLANQRLLLLPNFATTYAPQPAVTKPYPTGTVDFGATATTGVYRSSAYSTYNWELFLHIPTLVATRLMQDQRFADALTWIHYVFDPTDTTRTYWRSLPLQTVPKESMQAWLQRLDSCDPELARLVAEWKDHPFQPHLIARMRLVTYQKYVVKLYLDIVLAWADNLYDRDTLESVNQATQLYVLAAELLGPRPRRLPPPGVPEPRTFAQLRDRLDALSNAAVEFENTFPTVSTATVSSTAEAVGVLGMGRTLYFCLPPDDRMLAYWDTVERRLFTIRHSMNRAGVLRQLPLFEPPIDPGLLVRAAAQGLSLDSVLAELDAPRPQHRFEHVLRRANDACADLKALGAQLLAALERRDSEQLTQLRAAHETAGLEAVLAERLVAERDAQAQVDAVAASREVPVERLRYLQLVTGAEEHVPQPGELLPAMSYAPKPQTEAGVALIPEESQELAALHSARDWQVRATMMEVMASLAHYIPSFAVHVEPFGVGAEIAFGGEHVGPALAAIGKYLGGLSAEDTYDATHASRMAVLRRRGQDFAYQANVAARELVAIDKQATVAAIGQELAVLQREHAEQAIERSRQVEQVLGSHYTDDELYGWMIGKLAGTYFGAYQLAYGLAKQAERCYRFERGISDSAIITFGAWDNLRKGLLAGEQLQLQLRQLERTHAEQHVRDLELTRHVSVLQHAPMALIALRETGTCEVDLPEWLFDLDHPGHYLRRLVTVSVSVPAVVGPYGGVNATLTLLGHETRVSPALRNGKYERDHENPDDRFVDDYAAVQQIATSSGLNDSGLFELDLHDPRYLPFEGAGVTARWRLTLDPDSNSFDTMTVSDVVLHLRYTARDGGEVLRRAAQQRRRAVLADVDGLPLHRLFSLKHEFPSEWHRLKTVAEPDGTHVQTVQLSRDRFPLLFRRATLAVGAVELFGVPAAGSSPTGLVTMTTPAPASTPVALGAGAPVPGLLHQRADLDPVRVLDQDAAAWRLSVPAAGVATSLDQLDDLLLLCHFTATPPA